MDDMLRRIYEGDLHPEEKMVPTTQEYHMQKALVRKLEDAFLEFCLLRLGTIIFGLLKYEFA